MDAEEINKELEKALIQRLEEYGDDALRMTKNQQKESSRQKGYKTKDKIRTSRKKKQRQTTRNDTEMCVVQMKKQKHQKQDDDYEDTSQHVGMTTGAEEKETACRQPRVIEFVEPGRRALKTSEQSALAKHKKTRKMVNNKGAEKRLSDQDAEDFKEIAREVREFGVTGFSRKEQRKYAQQKAQALGAKAPRGQKMPYPILMYAKKVRQQREQEQQELNKAMGIFTKKMKEKSKKDSISARNHGHWVDGSANGLNATLGRYKAGVQRISRADLKKVNSSKR